MLVSSKLFYILLVVARLLDVNFIYKCRITITLSGHSVKFNQLWKIQAGCNFPLLTMKNEGFNP